MNNPKVYLTVFFTTCLILYALLKLSPRQDNTSFQAEVVSQTLTQSLDGHRRYLQVMTERGERHLIQSDPLIDCPKGSTVLVALDSNLFADTESLKFVRCLTTSIE